MHLSVKLGVAGGFPIYERLEEKLFVERSDLFLKLLDARWPQTEELVNGMVKVLSSLGIDSGNLIDVCCGNGRVSVYMAKKGFRAVGVDVSEAFLNDAEKKAREHHVADMVRFLEGDVRTLKKVVGHVAKPFDASASQSFDAFKCGCQGAVVKPLFAS